MNQARRHLAATSTRRRRTCAGVGAALLMGLGAALVPAMSSGAPGNAGPFQIDGSVDAGVASFTDPSGSAKEPGPINASTTKIGVIHRAAPPMLGLTNPNANVDLKQAWLGSGKDSVTQDDWIYFAWERDSTSGSGVIAFEFMQARTPVACDYSLSDSALAKVCNPFSARQAGDFIILWDQQGGARDLVVRTWKGTSPATLYLDAPVKLTDSPDLGRAAYSADGSRGEAAINLTDGVLGGQQRCVSYANTVPSTITGNSDTADYKDTILEQVPPISNCQTTTRTEPRKGDGTAITESQDGVPALDLAPGGTSVRDAATVSITGSDPLAAGSVSFTLCGPTALSSTALCTATVAGPGVVLAGSTALDTTKKFPQTVLSPAVVVTEPGRYCWRADYSGGSADSGIPGSTDSTLERECFVIKAVPVSLSTAQSWVPNDSATLSAPAGGSLAGSVVFTLYPSADCSGTAIYTSAPVAVAGASPQTVRTANTVAVDASGDFSWKVAYTSTNSAQLSVAESCEETSSLTIDNGSAVSSTP